MSGTPAPTPATRAALAQAAFEAEQLRSAILEPEHLLLGVLKIEAIMDPRVRIDGFSSADMDAARQEAAAVTAALESARVDCTRARRRLRQLWREAHPVQQTFQGYQSPRCTAVMDRAAAIGQGSITLAAMAQALANEPSAMVDALFGELGTTRERIGERLAGSAVQAAAGAQPAAPAGRPSKAAAYGRDLTALAREGKLTVIVGRDTEIKQLGRVLMQAKKRNALLLGDAGVGKTAIVEGLAVKLASGKAPEALARLRLVEVSIGALLAGARYRGDVEERIQEILTEAERDPDLVLFIDEIHMALGAGAAEGGADIAGLLKPALARGTARVIGATTTREYRKYFEKDAALERRFQIVWVEEPSRETALAILEALRPRFEQHHAVRIAPAAIAAAVDLARQHLPDRRLPDKAIDVLDQACARARLSTFSGVAAAGTLVGADEVAAVVSELARIPVERLTEDESRKLLGLESALAARVIGQPRAVAAVAEAVRAARAGLRDPNRPLGVFLFLGPTGVGKTELARALASALFGKDDRLLQFDMSEYSERHSVARLIGSPPGYVGYGEGGQLTERVRTSPSSVVLFDEIEKAHPDVYDLFLQIFDEGRLTDGAGRRVSFTEAVIVLTSNLGSADPGERRRPIGLLPPDAGDLEDAEPAEDAELEARIRKAVGDALRPELRNRIQKEIVFRRLDRGAIERIMDKMLHELEARSGQVRIELDAAARGLLLERGYSREMGARAMRRAITELVEEPLGRYLLSGGVPSDARPERSEAPAERARRVRNVARFVRRPGSQTLEIESRADDQRDAASESGIL